MAPPVRVVGMLVAVLGLSALAAPVRALSASAMPPRVGPANVSAPADVLPLPRPQQALVLQVPGLTADRLRVSHVPGPVDDREDVTVRVDALGAPSTVEVVQRLRISGVGDYGIYERGPARRAEALDGTAPPVAKLGTVVWQGFSPGRRELAARLTLDPGIEALRLPLGVGLEFAPRDGGRGALGAGGVVPTAGTLTVTLSDQTAQSAVPVATGAADATALARVAEALLAAAAAPGREPPVAGRGLPVELPASGVGARQIPVTAALAISGVLSVRGSTAVVRGPGVTPTGTGGRLHGVLNGGSVTFTVDIGGPATLGLDLVVTPTVDRRTVPVPRGSESWTAWAQSGPSIAERRAATDTVVAAAAAAVRAADFYPYLQADLPGRASGSFRYALAAPGASMAPRAALRPRPAAIAVSLLAALLIAGNATALRRLA